MQGLFLLDRDSHFQVKAHTNVKNTTILANFRIVSQDNPKPNMCFHQELNVKMFTLFHVLTHYV